LRTQSRTSEPQICAPTPRSPTPPSWDARARRALRSIRAASYTTTALCRPFGARTTIPHTAEPSMGFRASASNRCTTSSRAYRNATQVSAWVARYVRSWEHGGAKVLKRLRCGLLLEVSRSTSYVPLAGANVLMGTITFSGRALTGVLALTVPVRDRGA